MKTDKTHHFMFVLTLLGFYFLSPFAMAGPSKVGNGDEGSDLEGSIPLLEGPIVKARQAAIRQLQKINVQGIIGLGNLSAEINSSPLYMAKKNVTALLPEDQGTYHSSMQGQVYARTFAQPHADTRFFPIAEKLDEDQLVALHIHEALHRSLPEEIREDEAKVSKITLAITAPNAHFDQVSAVVRPLLPRRYFQQASTQEHEIEHFEQPSSVGYELRIFSKNEAALLSHPVSQLHTLHSHLYPFGGKNNPIGIGLEFAMVKMLGADSDSPAFKSGPLGISARSRLWSIRGFDIGAWAQVHLNTLSNEELKNSLLGRDTYSLGLTMQKQVRAIYLENTLGFTFKGSSSATIAQQTANYDFGSVIAAEIRSGVALGNLRMGGFMALHLGDHLRVFQNDGSNFDQEIGRYRLISTGPELSWVDRDFTVKLKGKFILDATNNANFDFLGNLLGQGATQGEVSASLSLHL